MTRCRAREACLPRRDRPREASRTAPRTGTPGRWSRDGVEEGVRNSTRVRRRPLRVETILRRGVMTRTRRRGRRRGCTHQRQHRELVYLSSPRRPPRRRLVALVHRAAPRARERRSDEQHLPKLTTRRCCPSLAVFSVSNTAARVPPCAPSASSPDWRSPPFSSPRCRARTRTMSSPPCSRRAGRRCAVPPDRDISEIEPLDFARCERPTSPRLIPLPPLASPVPPLAAQGRHPEVQRQQRHRDQVPRDER